MKLVRIPLWRHILEIAWPPLRWRRETRLRAVIDWLCDHPEVPVEID